MPETAEGEGYVYPHMFMWQDIPTQIARLEQLFPGIGTCVLSSLTRRAMPLGAEGLYMIPHWKVFSETYVGACNHVIQKFQSEWPGFVNCLGNIVAENLRQSSLTQNRFDRLVAQQRPCQLIVVPAQFGLRRRGQTAHDVRYGLTRKEFGLGLFHVAIMILTHPTRMKPGHLGVDCIGDEYDDPHSDGAYDKTPGFWSDPYTGALTLDSGSVLDPSEFTGAGTGFTY
jgi:hypothetical protein